MSEEKNDQRHAMVRLGAMQCELGNSTVRSVQINLTRYALLRHGNDEEIDRSEQIERQLIREFDSLAKPLVETVLRPGEIYRMRLVPQSALAGVVILAVAIYAEADLPEDLDLNDPLLPNPSLPHHPQPLVTYIFRPELATLFQL